MADTTQFKLILNIQHKRIKELEAEVEKLEKKLSVILSESKVSKDSLAVIRCSHTMLKDALDGGYD